MNDHSSWPQVGHLAAALPCLGLSAPFLLRAAAIHQLLVQLMVVKA